MTDCPLVTVVTPSLNHDRFIRATIESVLSQDYPRIEYIVVDGASTDSTATIVQDYASRLTFIREPDRGQSHAVNKGFRLARGSVLAWLNSDDLYLPGAIRAAVSGLERSRTAAAVYGEGYLIDVDGAVTRRFPSTRPFDRWRLVHLSDYILQQSVFFRGSSLNEIGLLDEDLHFVMDWDLLIRIAKRYELAYIPHYLACLREYPEAKSFSGGARRIAEIGRLMRRHTGTWLSPAFATYALEAYKPVWSEWIGRHVPDRASAHAQRCVAGLANFVIDRVTSSAEKRCLNETAESPAMLHATNEQKRKIPARSAGTPGR